jgi:dipeptidyl aminopeptidase/acylaminoacyl peptidase
VRLFALVCAAVFLLVAPAIAAPLEVYGRRPAMDQVEISPGGTRLAFIAEIGAGQRVVVRDVAQKKIIAAVSAGEFKIRSIQWADEDHLIVVSSKLTELRGVTTSTAKNEYAQGVVLTVSQNKVQPLLYEGDAEALLILQGEPVVRRSGGQTIIFAESVAFVDGSGRDSLFRTNLARRRTTLVKAGEPTTYAWLLDQEGKILGEAHHFESSGSSRIKLRDRAGLMRTVDTPEGAKDAYFLGLGRDNNSVLVGYEKDEKDIVAEIALDTLSWSDPLIDTDVSRLIWHPATHQLLGYATLTGDTTTYTFFDPADQRAWRSVTAVYRGQSVTLLSMTDDRRRFVVSVDSPTEGLAYALVDLDAKTADWLGEAYVGLTAKDISPVQPISYKAADGLEITGYLTLPAGAEAKNLPLVVLPHGGPAVRDAPGFDWWSQALASRGYAVLQPNFRGSDGFGRAFLEAGHGEWGKKMQTDLSDGVRDLAAKGIVDPKRVCIVGASYGGYAALAGATIDTGVYRCAVSVAGPSDLKRMLSSDKRAKGVGALRYWSRFMGVDGARDPDLALISPAALASRVEIPVLLIHGKDDVVVNYEQSTLMADALRAAGKPVEFVTLDGEDHWLSRSETRLKMLESTVAFLEKHNPPDAGAR